MEVSEDNWGLGTFLGHYSIIWIKYTAIPYRARTGFSLCSKFSQGKTCFHYREPMFSLQGFCIHYRDFPVRITTQGDPFSHYREWVCSVHCVLKQKQLRSVLEKFLNPKYLEIPLLYIGCKKKNTLFPFKKVCDIF